MTTEEIVVKKLCDYFSKQQFIIKTNVRLNKNHVEIDVLCKKNNKFYGIEVKAGVGKNILEKALIQAIRFKPYVNYTYIGMPFIPKTYFKYMCESIGVGIILIEEVDVSIPLDAKENENVLDIDIDFFINKKNHYDFILESHDILLIPLLIIIKKYENRCISTTYISGLLNCSQQTVSRLINIAVEREYVTKKSYNRSYSYELTESGRNRLNKLGKEIINEPDTLDKFN